MNPMLQTQIEDISDRLKMVELKLDKVTARESAHALKYALDDPAASASKAGIAVESILFHLYCKKSIDSKSPIPKNTFSINQLKEQLCKLKVMIPDGIKKNIELVQYYRNSGSHAHNGEFKVTELTSVLNALFNIIRWYLEEVEGVLLDFTNIGIDKKKEQYRDLVMMAYADGILDQSEKNFLEVKRMDLELSKEDAQEIETEIVAIQNNMYTFSKSLN